MALDPDDIRVFGDGTVSVAPYGTTLPTTLSGALDSAFHDLGYLTEDGVEITKETDNFELSAWQARGIILSRPISRIYRVKIATLENDDIAHEVWNDGGTYAASGSDRVYTPPDNASYDEWSVVIDATDGVVSWRMVCDHCVVSDTDSIMLKKDEATKFGFQFTVIGGEDGSAGWRRYESTTAVS